MKYRTALSSAFVALVLTACSSNNYYDETREGSGIFRGADSYRLIDPLAAQEPYAYKPRQVASIASGRSEIRIFTPKSYAGDLARLTTACAKRAGVTGQIRINTGTVRAEKFASLLPTANVSLKQQERTATCVEASIEK